ncbi:hypothetical protein EYF80_057872 [Liparis tanakae]|uniref:Uncharacterized protein n=1 Tax=Liparis tanakae TaxID=230148 RepID=A0A4Z2ETK8_9TELE|nr:hypothetical protein EYF80_057872 [Liparis tanakae]
MKPLGGLSKDKEEGGFDPCSNDASRSGLPGAQRGHEGRDTSSRPTRPRCWTFGNKTTTQTLRRRGGFR